MQSPRPKDQNINPLLPLNFTNLSNGVSPQSPRNHTGKGETENKGVVQSPRNTGNTGEKGKWLNPKSPRNHTGITGEKEGKGVGPQSPRNHTGNTGETGKSKLSDFKSSIKHMKDNTILKLRPNTSLKYLKDSCNGCLSTKSCEVVSCDGCPKNTVLICPTCRDAEPVKQIFCKDCTYEIFLKLDKDNSGNLDVEEIKTLLYTLEQGEHKIEQIFNFLEPIQGTSEENINSIVSKIFELYDKDKNGKIDFGEFLNLLSHVPYVEKLFFTDTPRTPNPTPINVFQSPTNTERKKLTITSPVRDGVGETFKLGPVSITLDKGLLRKSAISFKKTVVTVEEKRVQKKEVESNFSQQKITTSKLVTSTLLNSQEKEAELMNMFAKYSKNDVVRIDDIINKIYPVWGLEFDVSAEPVLSHNNTRATVDYKEFSNLTNFLLFAKRAFDIHDVNNDNTLDREELKKCVHYVLSQSTSMGGNKTFVDGMTQIFTDGTQLKERALPCSTFTTLMLYFAYLNDRYKKSSGSVTVDASELQMFMRLMAIPITFTEAKCIFARANMKTNIIKLEDYISIIISAIKNWGDIKEAAQLERYVSNANFMIRRVSTKRLISHENYQVNELMRGQTFKILKPKKEDVSIIDKIMKQVQITKTKWEDPDFAATWSSLFPQDILKRKLVSSWKRPCEIHPQAQLFVDGVNEGDVVQGALGSCWFLSALSILSQTGHEQVKKLFVNSNPECGFYQIRLFKDNEWHIITIDDYLPCDTTGKPAFAHCSAPDEFWVPLVEKAYAKLHGNYGAIENGSVAEALVDLTGSVSETIDVENTQEFWEMMCKNNTSYFLMGCTSFDPDAPAEKEIPLGILLNHAYGILECKNIQKHRLLKIRNPWGRYEWKGPWSDGSWEWTPYMKDILEHEFGDDGIFWMCFEDFAKYFNRLFVLKAFDESWHKYAFRGEWEGKSAGGCSNYATFSKNPQWAFTAPQDATIFVSLRQHDVRRFHKQPPPIGICALEGNSHSYHHDVDGTSVLFMSQFMGAREVSLQINAKQNQTYILVPCTYEPQIEMPFFIIMFSTVPLKVTELKKEAPVVEVKGSWEGKTAGGCLNYHTWRNNNQYILGVGKKGTVSLILQQHSEEVHHIGMYLWSSEDGEVVLDSNGVIHQTQLINNPTVTDELNLEPGKYVVMPCTFYPNKSATFTLKTTNIDCTLKMATPWYEENLDGEWKTGKSGGCQNYPSWKDNPKYSLEVTETTKLSITLYTRDNTTVPMGIYITDLKMATTIIGTSQFVNSDSITQIAELPPGKYVLFVCTFYPNHFAPYHVQLQCNHKVSLKQSS